MPAAYYLLFLLVFVPWTPFFFTPRSRTDRVIFAPLFLLGSRRVRTKLLARRITLAALRSTAILAFLLLPLSSASSSVRAAREARLCEDAPTLPASVLIVDGTDSGPKRRELPIESPSVADYLACALGEGFDRLNSFELSSAPLERLSGYDAIVLADLASPTDAELKKLTQYLSADPKRYVLIWQGERADPALWSAAFRALGLDAAAAETDLRDRRVPRRFQRSPLSRIFPDAEHARLDALPIERASTVWGKDVEPALIDSATDAVVYARIGERWYWFGASPDPNAGALSSAEYFTTLTECVLRYPLTRGVFTNPPKREWTRALWALIACASALELLCVSPSWKTDGKKIF